MHSSPVLGLARYHHPSAPLRSGDDAGEHKIIDKWLDAVERSIRRSLASAPAMPLWGPPMVRRHLLASLQNVGKRQREAPANELYSEGDVAIPGIVPREAGLWY